MHNSVGGANLESFRAYVQVYCIAHMHLAYVSQVNFLTRVFFFLACFLDWCRRIGYCRTHVLQIPAQRKRSLCWNDARAGTQTLWLAEALSTVAFSLRAHQASGTWRYSSFTPSASWRSQREGQKAPRRLYPWLHDQQRPPWYEKHLSKPSQLHLQL